MTAVAGISAGDGGTLVDERVRRLAALGEALVSGAEIDALVETARRSAEELLRVDVTLLGAHAPPPAGAAVVVGRLAAAAARLPARDLDFLRAVAAVVTGALARRDAFERLRHDALHDALTGLPNRTLLRDRTAGALARLRRGSWRVALLCVDIDRLKVLNEWLGHEAGDQLLRLVGPRLHDALRPGDTVARFSGDGFSVLCEGIADEAHAARIADRVIAAFAAPFTIAGEERAVSASIGVALAGAGKDPDELIANAEAAMYLAKDRGRARRELHDAAQRARVAARQRMEQDLRRALDTDDVWIAYQPIHAAGGGIAAVEALARWTHPERGAIAPAEFIPIAEDGGIIDALGERVLRDACRQVAVWRHAPATRELKLSVNVSARQVMPGLVDAIAATLADTGLAPDALWLELTEGLLLEDSGSTFETLGALRALGVRLVLDDFGTGYSSLGYLRRFPIETIKIDRSFIADLGEDGRGDAAIVAAIVGMAQALGLSTVPEGVETAGQLERLIALGCEYAQGYHLGRPVPAAELF